MNPLDLALGILAPGVLVGCVLLVSWGLASSASRRNPKAPAPAVALVLPLGMLLGLVLLFGWVSVPRESWRWLGWVCIAIALLGAFEAREGLPRGARWALRISMVLVILGCLLRKRLLPSGADPQWVKLALYFSSPLVLIALWRALLPRLGAVAGAGALWFLCVATQLLVLFGGSLKFAQAGGALAGGLGALVVACWLRPSVVGMSGAIAPVAVLLSSLAFLGLEFSFAAYSPWLFLAPALAPLLLAVPFLKSNGARLLAMALPVVVALVVAYRAYTAEAG